MTFTEKASSNDYNEEEQLWLVHVVHYIKSIRDGHAANETINFAAPILKPVVKNTYPLFLAMYGLLAVFGILSNVAVLIYISRLRLFYDSTHAFTINLVLCHIVQCVVTLPTTLMILLIQNWLWGQFLCFFLPFIQDIPLHAAMFTHLLIAWDRMRWLSDPLKGRIPAFVCSCATWLAGVVIALPYPIYTAYVDLGTYQKEFTGVGVCMYNLVDDMQEYSRGLFVLLYCLPSTVLAYMYIRTSRDLKVPEEPLGVMMFEVRSSLRHKRSASTAMARPNREELSKAYDMFDAGMDVSKDKRAQRHLGAMAATQVLCLLPLSVLKLAKLVLVETYDNTDHFDLTYLMFIWIAFLPTAINPWIYASLVIPSHMRERLLGYFRLNEKRKPHIVQETRSSIEESSVMLENCTSTMLNPPRIVSTMEADNDKYRRVSTRSHGSRRTRHDEKRAKDDFMENSLSINNSCSNITASTYCINSTERESIHFETSPSAYTEKRLSLSANGSTPRGSFRKKLPQIPPQAHLMEKRGSYASTVSRKGSTSTLEHDHEIIDMLERDRSMEFNVVPERRPSFRASRKLPRSPREPVMLVETDGYAGDQSTFGGSHGGSFRRPKLRRPSYEGFDPLQVIDRKIMRTVSNEPRYDVMNKAQNMMRRHSSEKYQMYNGGPTDF